MQTNSFLRTKKSLKNSFVAVSLQFLFILVGFFSRKIFLEYLGTEILGLNSTAQSLIGFLNLAELGIGSAIAVTLYKPLFDNDKEAAKEIVALQGWLYKRIAFLIIIASIVVAFFFPKIFAKTSLPLWYAYLSFGVLLFSSLLGYFVNYKQIILSANQEDYKVQLSWRAISIVKFILQAAAVKYCTSNPFIYWVLLEFIFSIVASVSLNMTIRKSAPYVMEKVDNPIQYRKKYPQVEVKVKQVFVHKICSVFITQSTPIILYSFTTLSMVAIYGNYLLITNNLGYLLASIFTGLSAGIGSVIAENNTALTNKLFREIYSVRFVIVSVCAICILLLSQSFIKLWIGEEFLLSTTTLLLIVVNFWLINMKTVTDTFLAAYGLFSDILSPVIEAVLNVILSIVLGKFYGLDGILIGIGISQVAIHFIWKPYFLFTRGLKAPLIGYVKVFLKHCLVFMAVSASMYFLHKALPEMNIDSLSDFLIYAFIVLAISFTLMESILLCIDFGARSFVIRLLSLRKQRIHNDV